MGIRLIVTSVATWPRPYWIAVRKLLTTDLKTHIKFITQIHLVMMNPVDDLVRSVRGFRQEINTASNTSDNMMVLGANTQLSFNWYRCLFGAWFGDTCYLFFGITYVCEINMSRKVGCWYKSWHALTLWGLGTHIYVSELGHRLLHIMACRLFITHDDIIK